MNASGNLVSLRTTTSKLSVENGKCKNAHAITATSYDNEPLDLNFSWFAEFDFYSRC